MAAVTSPQLEDLLGQFNAIQVYLQQMQGDVLANRSYVAASRGRTQRYQRAIGSELDNLFYQAHSWADTGLQQAYLGGWAGVYDGSPFTVGADGLANMAAVREAYRVQLNNMESYMRRDTTRFLTDMRTLGDEQLGQTAATFDAKLGIKVVTQDVTTAWGVSQRSYRLSDYAKMLSNTANQKAFNLGTLDAAATAGFEFVECTDGPECGWDSHNDPDKANGKIVSLEEAAGNPLSHPNCVRQFVPTKKTPADEKKGMSLKTLGLALAGIGAAGLVARAAVTITDDIVNADQADRFAAYSRISNIYQRTFNRIADSFIRGKGADAEILPFYLDPLPPTPQELPVAVGQGFIPEAQAFALRDATTTSIGDWGTTVTQWGNALMDHRITTKDLPDWVRNSIHALDSDSTNAIKDKFMLFSQYIHGKKATSKGLDELAKVLNAEARIQQWNHWGILANYDKLKSDVSLTWTKYGPRTRIDLTDFLRGRITLTKDGIRRSITFNPAGNLRSMLALSQDGTLMGAVRLVPNSIFRGVIETDEWGKITGNVRLVPRNFPFKVILRFETPRPADWKYTGLIPGKDFVDLTARGGARGFTLQDFSFRDVYGTLRQMQLKDILFEARIFRNTPFQLSTSFGVPIPDIKAIIERLRATGLIWKDGGGWTGVFQWRPSFAAREELQKIIASSTQKIMGSIRFSELKVKYARFLPNISSTAFFDSFKFREVLTSIRLSGLTAIKNASNMEIFSEILQLPRGAWDQFTSVINEVDARIQLFMRAHNLATPGEIADEFGRRYAIWHQMFPDVNPADMYKGTLQAITGMRDENVIKMAQKAHKIIPGGQTHKKWLQILAGIEPGDSAAVAELKLQDMIFFMRSLNLESPDVIGLLDQVTNGMLHAAAQLMPDTGRISTALPDALKLTKAQVKRDKLLLGDYNKGSDLRISNFTVKDRVSIGQRIFGKLNLSGMTEQTKQEVNDFVLRKLGVGEQDALNAMPNTDQLIQRVMRPNLQFINDIAVNAGMTDQVLNNAFVELAMKNGDVWPPAWSEADVNRVLLENSLHISNTFAHDGPQIVSISNFKGSSAMLNTFLDKGMGGLKSDGITTWAESIIDELPMFQARGALEAATDYLATGSTTLVEQFLKTEARDFTATLDAIAADPSSITPPMVFRGVSNPTAEAEMRLLKAGDEISTNHFWSTSTDPITAAGFATSSGPETVLMAVIPKNGNGAFISGIYEQEYVLKQGLHLRVVRPESPTWLRTKQWVPVAGGQFPVEEMIWQEMRVILFQEI